jgi:glycosyltransferase involved in cell wall biosynthesis
MATNNRITVITICFNNLGELQHTMASVDDQTQPPFEHWIIDGSSNTDIKNWLETHPQPSYRKWICERDKGIADAFNKGIAHATGDILVMLNSADSLHDAHVLATVEKAFAADSSLQWLHGKFTMLRGGIWVTIGKPFDKAKLYRGMRSTNHQTMYVKKKLYDRYGPYSMEFKIAMDYDYLCRISGEKNTFLNVPLAKFAPAGISSVQYLPSLVENKKVFTRHFGPTFKLTVWQWRLKILYYLLNSPIGKWLYQLKVKLKLENM